MNYYDGMKLKKRLGFGALFAAFLVAVGTVALAAWVEMLALGGLHHSWPAVPALGYGATVLLMLVVAVLVRTPSTKE
jgi:hypothetical protein